MVVITGSLRAKNLARSILEKLSRLAVVRGNTLGLGSLEIRIRYIQYIRKGFLRKGASFVVHEFPAQVRGAPVESVIDVFERSSLVATLLIRSDGSIVFSGEGIREETEALMLLSKLEDELAREVGA